MTRLVSLTAIALLAVGCATHTQDRATPASAPHTQRAQPQPRPAEVVELRHFYLLSPGPGPSAKLVVTRSDLAAASDR